MLSKPIWRKFNYTIGNVFHILLPRGQVNKTITILYIYIIYSLEEEKKNRNTFDQDRKLVCRNNSIKTSRWNQKYNIQDDIKRLENVINKKIIKIIQKLIE